ncbi:MAG TPA: hypothetical protein VFA11_01850 [Acidimicrobiales bacterium]|nr:hypothetical protein [Acidimicrobiales bacterium]
MTLVLALIMMVFLSIVISVIASQVVTSLKAGEVVQDRAVRQYDADAGVELAVQALRTDIQSPKRQLCLDPVAEPQALTPPGGVSFNGRQLTFSCSDRQGFTGQTPGTGFEGFSLITTTCPTGSLPTGCTKTLPAGASSLSTGQGVSRAFTLNGPVYTAATPINGSLPKPINITGGNFGVYTTDNSACGNTINVPGINVDGPLATPPGPYQELDTCVTPQAVEPVVTLPARPLTAAPNPQVQAGCTIFFPGLYTSPPTLGAANYFASGVYYFDFSGPWNFSSGGWALAGSGTLGTLPNTSPGQPYNQPIPTPGGAACANGAGMDLVAKGLAPSAAINGTGAEFILGKTARLPLPQGSGDQLDIQYRTDPTTGVTQGVSVYALQPADVASGASWQGADAWTWDSLTNPDPIIQTEDTCGGGGDSNDTALFNGLVDVVDAPICVRTQNGSTGFWQGLVAGWVWLDASANGTNGLAMNGAGSGPTSGSRTLVITSDAWDGTPGGSAFTRECAVVNISNSGSNSATVLSWRTDPTARSGTSCVGS